MNRKPIRYLQFGHYKVKADDLAGNRLSLRYSNTEKRVKGWKIVLISNLLRDIIIQLCNDTPLTQADYDELSAEEQRILDYTLMLTKYCVYNISSIKMVKKTILQTELARFDIVRGEILAGNNNPELFKELKTLILKLMQYSLIDPKSATELLLTICSMTH